MKRLVTVVAIAALASFASQAWSNEKGNGGDVVRCGPSERSGPRSVQHWRVLDSVFFRDSSTFKFRRFRNSPEAISAITQQLMQTVPNVGDGLGEFFSAFERKTDLKNGVVWITGIPKELRDENLYIEIPQCKSPQQAIVRVDGAPRRYYYNPVYQTALEQDGDEFSWMLVHEWLREYIDDADVIRVLNGYLHSEDFFRASESEVHDTLSKFGLHNKVGAVASEARPAQVRFEQLLVQLESLVREGVVVMNTDEERRKQISIQISNMIPDIWTVRAIYAPASLMPRYLKALEMSNRIRGIR